MARASRWARVALTVAAASVGPVREAHAQSPTTGAPAPAGGAAGETTFLVENMTRAELWRYFQPLPDAASEPDYAFVGSRSTLGASYIGRRWRARGALQYVRLENLPARAIGPGLLGTGAAYFFQAAGAFSYQFYLRELSLAWRSPSGLWVEGGRLLRAAERETPSGDAAIDRLVRDEVNGRLLGDMEWSFYQRAWDGVRGGVARGRWRVSATAAVPTQGTFEESANLPLSRVRVGDVEVAVDPGGLVRHTALRVFVATYDDTRPVTSRPDNANLRVTGADVRVHTFGATTAGAYPWRFGYVDAVVWAAVQRGHWWDHRHRAWSATSSLGHRWTGARWRPWLRAGVTSASGDADPRDATHGTFFPMLPSGDRVSGTNVYAQMNVDDGWLAVEAAPASSLDVRVGLRSVALRSSVDRWYSGSGATVRSGPYFGFQGRITGGETDLGRVVEAGLTWRPRRWWTLRAYGSRMTGGDAVAALFAGMRLTTAWLESTLRF
jgi:Alginate export